VLAKRSNRESDAEWVDAGLARWSPFEPVVSAAMGELGKVHAVGRYRVQGKTVFLSVLIQVRAVQDGAVAVVLQLPHGSPAFPSTIVGVESGVTGKMICGLIFGGVPECHIKFFDNAYPAQPNAQLHLSGFYEIA
jgi:hypothetical protein